MNGRERLTLAHRIVTCGEQVSQLLDEATSAALVCNLAGSAVAAAAAAEAAALLLNDREDQEPEMAAHCELDVKGPDTSPPLGGTLHPVVSR